MLLLQAIQQKLFGKTWAIADLTKIFIIHARRTGYGVIRSLRDYTKKFYVADTFKTPVFHSKYVKKSYLVKDITKVSNDRFLEDMISLAEDMGCHDEKPVVFTGKDDYLSFFSKNSGLLSNYYHFSFEPDHEILESALNKIKLVQFAKKANIEVPNSYTDQDSIDEISRKIRFPVIIKPAIKNSPDIDVVSKAFRLRLCADLGQLKEASSILKKIRQPYIIQEYLQGDDNELYTVGTYSYKGEMKAWSVSKKIRQFPPTIGECSLGKTIREDSLVEMASKLLRTIGLTGISQIEFKKSNGKYYLLEINPRVWSWHEINTKVGVNFCKVAVNQIKGNASGQIATPRHETKYWMFLAMDFLHNWMLKKRIGLLHLIKDFLNCDVEAFFDIRDPKPFLVHLKSTIPYIYRSIKSSPPVALD